METLKSKSTTIYRTQGVWKNAAFRDLLTLPTACRLFHYATVMEILKSVAFRKVSKLSSWKIRKQPLAHLISCCGCIQLHATVVSPDLPPLPEVISQSGAIEFLDLLRGRQE